ncbi:hypothetical protein [Peribacillus frigoritolerans]|uniref:hypothetical protein n=1 Tax=Peribacillus frigoritolerans TaxID=450367 RepID=UPI002E1B4934|nr:hypothetical protein [Peribacillus frigoritolerans]
MKDFFKLSVKMLAILLSTCVFGSILVFIAYRINNTIGDYLFVTIPYVFAIVFFYYLLNESIVNREKDNSIYMWLDKLDGSYNFLEILFGNHEVQEDTLENLDRVYKELLTYTGHDIRKLRLLKAYFKSVNNETSYDLLGKLFITFLFGLLATNLSNGNILIYINQIFSQEIKVSPAYETILDFIMVFLLFLTVITRFIKDLFSHKKRTKIIEEILEVCIKELES